MSQVRPSVAVVIPTKGRSAELITTLKSVLEQELKPTEVVVVDQSPADSLGVLVSQFATELAHEDSIPRLACLWRPDIDGPAAARNCGVHSSQSDIVVIIDDDVTLESDCLRVLVDSLASIPGAGGVGGIETQLESSSWAGVLYRTVFFLGPFADRKYWLARRSRKLKSRVHRVSALKTCLAAYWRHVLVKYPFNEAWKAPLLEDKQQGYVSGREYAYYFSLAARATHRVSALNRLKGQQAYEAAAISWAYFYRESAPKSLSLAILFGWLNIGLLGAAVTSSIRFRSMGPLLGLLSGWWKSLRGFKGQSYVAAT